MAAARSRFGVRNICLAVCLFNLLSMAILRYQQLQHDLIGSDVIVYNQYDPWNWVWVGISLLSFLVVWRFKLPHLVIVYILVINSLLLGLHSVGLLWLRNHWLQVTA